MDSSQQKLAHALLSSGLSQRGYAKAVTIMSLESVLAQLEGPGRRFPRDPEEGWNRADPLRLGRG